MKPKTPWWRELLYILTGKPATPATGSKAPTPKTTPKKPETHTGSDPYVYVTKTGKKFHYDADCQALQSAWARDEVFKLALSKARASGRTACSRCCWDYLHE